MKSMEKTSLDWWAIVLSSATVSALMNIAWNGWTRYRDKKDDRYNVCINIQHKIEEYIQHHVDNIEYRTDLYYWLSQQRPYDPNNEEEQDKDPEIPEFSSVMELAKNAKTTPHYLYSELKEASHTIYEIKKSTSSLIEESCVNGWRDEQVLSDLRIQEAASCGIVACKVADGIGKRIGARSKILELYKNTLKEHIQHQVSKAGTDNHKLIPILRPPSPQ